MPTASSRLLPLVVGNFPHKLRDRNTQCLYLVSRGSCDSVLMCWCGGVALGGSCVSTWTCRVAATTCHAASSCPLAPLVCSKESPFLAAIFTQHSTSCPAAARRVCAGGGSLQGCLRALLKYSFRPASPPLPQRGVFALAEGPSGGAVREGLLAGVVEHLIGIDVEIRWVGGS